MAVRVALREKLAYGFGNFGINLPFGMANAFLMFFYTDVYHVDAGVVGTIFLLARAADAVFDPVMGLLIDRTRTRWGKHRPYLVSLAGPFALSGVAVFAAVPLAGTAKLAYIAVSYTLVGIAYSAISLPLNSMLPTLTRDPAERNVINATRELLGTGAVVGVGYLTLPLVAALGGGSAASGFVRTAALFGFVTVIAAAVAFAFTREREAAVAGAATLTTRQSLAAARGNGPWVATMLVNFFFWIGFSGHIQSVVYYARDILGRAALVPDLMLTMTAILIGTGSSGWCANRVGKRVTGTAGSALAVCGTLLIPLSDGVLWVITASAVAYVGLGLIGGLLFSLMADAVDFGEWRNGVRAQGFLFAASSLGVKFGMSVGGGIGGWMLSASGYVAGRTVTSAVASGILWNHVYVPAISFALMGLSLLLFRFPVEYRRYVAAADAIGRAR